MDKSICKHLITHVIILIMVLLAMTDYAFAHKVTIFAWVEGDTVYTESKFSGGRKAKNAPIEVFDNHGKKILEGKTDDNGAFSFKVPRKTGMKIVLLAGMGHKGEWTLPVEEFEGETIGHKEKKVVNKRTVTKPDKIRESEFVSKENSVISADLTSEDIQKVVEKALDKKLKPVINRLNKSIDHGPSVYDIFGGIGYILGLMGIGAYFNYRNKKRDVSQP